MQQLAAPKLNPDTRKRTQMTSPAQVRQVDDTTCHGCRSQPSAGLETTPCACGGGCPRCARSAATAGPSLTVVGPSDASEVQARRVAEHVVRTPARFGGPDGDVRATAASADPRSSPLRQVARQTAATSDAPRVSADQETGIAALRGHGAPLPAEARDNFEARVGQRLGPVWLHAGARAAALASSMDATAFTIGRDIFFASGALQPDSVSGRRLLAHELTHVTQNAGVGDNIIRRDTPGAPALADSDPAAAEPAGPQTPSAAQAPAGADRPAEKPPDPDAGFTQCDFIDERISTAAQRALYELYKRGGDGRSAALFMLADVKQSILAGIYKADEQKPALMAREHGASWWTLTPAGQDATVFEKAKPPMMVFRPGVGADRARLATALQTAWEASTVGTVAVIAVQPSLRPCPISAPDVPAPVPDQPPDPGPEPEQTPPHEPPRCENKIDYEEWFPRRWTECDMLRSNMEIVCSAQHNLWCTIVPELCDADCNNLANIPRAEWNEKCVLSEAFGFYMLTCGIPQDSTSIRARIRARYRAWLGTRQ